MSEIRIVAEVLHSQETMDGAGVRLRRGFGYPEAKRFDPFLLFDDFSSLRADDHSAGFPRHPHRGIQTVTYLLNGHVKHRDSLGNVGEIGPGDVQWMTAGKGIIHEEMPVNEPVLTGFQLWVNLPQAHKLTSPRYQDIPSVSIPNVSLPGVLVKVIAGEFLATKGPVVDIFADPSYFDISLESTRTIEIPVQYNDTAFVYVITGSLGISNDVTVEANSILRYERQGDIISLKAGSTGARFLFVSGTPLEEPIAWYGPIVMNTDDEIRMAQQELRDGTFIDKDEARL